MQIELLEARLALSAASAGEIGVFGSAQLEFFFPQPRLRNLVTTGRNRYMVLEPGHKTTYAGVEEGEQIRLAITVTNRTRVIDGVRTRIVKERETLDGELFEISWNYFAIDRRTKHIYYFGEDVNFYEDGKLVDHHGSWRSGIDGATFGLIMPADPEPGMRFEHEIAPGIAMDRARVLTTDIIMRVPAGIFSDVMKVRETTPLEPGVEEFKFFARGVGMIKDAELELIGIRRADD